MGPLVPGRETSVFCRSSSLPSLYKSWQSQVPERSVCRHSKTHQPHPSGCACSTRSRCTHFHSYLCAHSFYQQMVLPPFLPRYNHFLQRVIIISKYYWSDDFLLPVQFFTSYSNLWFLG